MLQDVVSVKVNNDPRHLWNEIMMLRQRVQEQEIEIRDLERISMEDTLTGLSNRRSFGRELKRSFSYYKRYGRSGALLLIDVDNFKSVNDTLGHQAGDAILMHISNLLKTHTRDSDVVARLGGDEFCIILREVSEKEAMRKRDKIAQVIGETPCRVNGREVYTSVSVGACTFHKADDRDDLIEKADQSMYRAKSNQREKSVTS